MNLSNINKILAIEVNKLGDVVCATPAFYRLRKYFPNAELNILVSESWASLFNETNYIDYIHKFPNNPSTFILLKIGLQLRRLKFDLVCSLSPIVKNALLAHICATRYAIGYLDFEKRIPNYLKSPKIKSKGFSISPQPPSSYQISETALRVCDALGINENENSNHLYTFLNAQLLSTNDLENLGIPCSVPFIIIHPFASWEFRSWSTKNTSELINLLHQNYSYHIVLIGSHFEKENLEKIKSMCDGQERITIYAGDRIDRVALALKRCSLLISTDSGLLHLGTALGTPAIGLYGPVPPELTAPPSKVNIYLYSKIDCSPCEQKKCVRPNNPCMNLITPMEVFNNVSKIFIERPLCEVA